MSDIPTRLHSAVQSGALLQSSATNIHQMLARSDSPVVQRSIAELVETGAWDELNDRFYKTLAFGTGGLRGRTIGKIVTVAERGRSAKNGAPEFPCVGTNAMNFYNITRATRGLVAYLQDWNRHKGISTKPKIVIAHDPRFFS